MKRKLLILLVLSSLQFLFAQVIRVQEEKSIWKKYEYSYISYLNVETKNPDVVIWNLTAEEALLSENVKDNRRSSFISCGIESASPSDYTKATIAACKGIYTADRGHMCPANNTKTIKIYTKQ